MKDVKKPHQSLIYGWDNVSQLHKAACQKYLNQRPQKYQALFQEMICPVFARGFYCLIFLELTTHNHNKYKNVDWFKGGNNLPHPLAFWKFMQQRKQQLSLFPFLTNCAKIRYCKCWIFSINLIHIVKGPLSVFVWFLLWYIQMNQLLFSISTGAIRWAYTVGCCLNRSDHMMSDRKRAIL